MAAAVTEKGRATADGESTYIACDLIYSYRRASTLSNMSSTSSNHLRILVSTALLMLLSSGCANQGHMQRPLANSTCCWQVVNSKCYGYYPTCWRTWSDECQMCIPPDGMAPQICGSEILNPAPLDVPPPIPESERIETPTPVLPGGDMTVPPWQTSPEIQPEPNTKQPPSPSTPPILQTPSAASWPEHRPLVGVQANAW